MAAAAEEKHQEHESQRLLDATTKTRADGSLEVSPADVWATSKLPTWAQTAITELFVFITIHYNVWLAPFVLLFYYLIQNGYVVVVVALVAIYMPSFLDGSEMTAQGRQWDSFRQWWLWNPANRGLKIKNIREAALDSAKQYIFGFHPHAIIVLSRVATYGGLWEKIFPNITYRILGASSVFKVPLGRELCLWLGGVDASRPTAEKVLKAGSSIMVYPGGVPEIFLTDPNSKENVLILKKRLGFIKLAMRNGADLVPVFVFGEKFLYKVWKPSKQVVDFFQKKLKFPLIIFWGRFLWMPQRLPEGKSYGAVFGKPIALKRNENPTEEDLLAAQALYIKEVERLFSQYKKEYGYDDDETLVIT